MKITKTLRLEPELIKQIEDLAAKENRNFSNMIETILNSSLHVKDNHKKGFEKWLKVNGYDDFGKSYFKGTNLKHESELLERYKKGTRKGF